jgi:hypothetical protein
LTEVIPAKAGIHLLKQRDRISAAAFKRTTSARIAIVSALLFVAVVGLYIVALSAD